MPTDPRRLLPDTFSPGEYRRPSGATVYVTSLAPPAATGEWWTDAAGTRLMTVSDTAAAEMVRAIVAQREAEWTAAAERTTDALNAEIAAARADAAAAQRRAETLAAELAAASADSTRRIAELVAELAALKAARPRRIRKEVERGPDGLITAIREVPA